MRYNWRKYYRSTESTCNVDVNWNNVNCSRLQFRASIWTDSIGWYRCLGFSIVVILSEELQLQQELQFQWESQLACVLHIPIEITINTSISLKLKWTCTEEKETGHFIVLSTSLTSTIEKLEILVIVTTLRHFPQNVTVTQFVHSRLGFCFRLGFLHFD